MSDTNLTAEQLARRWGWEPGIKSGISPATLKNWRALGKGPRYIKPGKVPLYPLDAVEEYERAHSFTSNADEASRK